MATGLRLRHRSTLSAPGAWPRRRSCCARVSDRRRTEPPHRAGRAARADDGARRVSPQGAARPRAARAPRSRSCCSPRATAPRSTRAARTSTPRSATSATSSPSRPGATPDELRRPALHVLRRRRGRAPLRGRRRPRLDDRRRERDPRPGARGVAGRRARGHGRPAARRALFRHAVESGKRVRTETGIGRHAVSIPSAAVTVAAEHLGSLDGPTVLVRRRRRDGRGLAIALSGAGVGEVVVANRTVSARAARSPARIGGAPSRSTRSPTRSSSADVLLSSTGSADVLVERADIEMVMARRDGRPLLVVDVAVPARRRPGRPRGQRRDAARPRRPARTTGERSLQQRRRRDRQGPRDPRRRARAVPRRAGRHARSRRSSPRCASRAEAIRTGELAAVPAPSSTSSIRDSAPSSRRSRRASSTSCCTSRPCG